MSPGPLMIHHEDDIDSRTRWWDTYPSRGYNIRSRPKDAFSNYLDQAFGEPRRLARSASAIGLTFIREAVVSEKPVIKFPSFSSLAPSHALPYDLRVPTRYIPAFRHRRTDTEKWFLNAYAPAEQLATHVAVSKPYVTPSYLWPQFVHVPYYTKVVDKPRFDFDKEGYVKRSCDYLHGYVGDRLRYDNYSIPYVYNSYEKKVDNRYLRYIRGGPESFVGASLGLPKHPGGLEKQRIYRLTGRMLY